MSYRRTTFEVGEWYHCYTRSVERSLDSRNIFKTQADYERFLQALHLANNTTTIRRSDLYKPTHKEILEIPRKDPIVCIGAYCIMPTHFHLLMKEKIEGGISKIMHTVGTAFSMYYNLKHERVGNVFIKPFRSKHVQDQHYLQHVVDYIHLNPVELYEPRWKEGIVNNITKLENNLRSYRFNSLVDYVGSERLERVLLDSEAMNLTNQNDQSLQALINETAEFYKEYDQNF